ncbi:MAG: multidrug transporter [Chloroflexi bacterium]|nr:MAG: multidrug transporter [Chloroflexota bacterium]
MRKIIIEDKRYIPPFNEPARELTVLNKRLWLHQRDILAPYCDRERPVRSFDEIPKDRVETLVYRDNLFFDKPFFEEFIQRARELGKACRVAFSLEDRAITSHALTLQKGIRRQGDVYVADMWYFPRGLEEEVVPLVMDTEAYEVGYYHVPTYMAPQQGDLVYQVPTKAFLSIEHWVHVFVANIVFGIFAEGARKEKEVKQNLWAKLRILGRSLLERRQFLSSSALVYVGKNVEIDPTAVIQGPTYIGDNSRIHAGAYVCNSIVGENVNIMQGAQLLLSVVSDGCYLPFRASLFMTTLMEHSIVAQNTCLQMCVVGRNTFIGAGTTFTDFNLLPKPIRAMYEGELREAGFPVLGGCVGHNCRLGSGLIIYPARMIESDTVLFASPERRVITKNISYEESDHHKIPGGTEMHPRLYPREPQDEA